MLKLLYRIMPVVSTKVHLRNILKKLLLLFWPFSSFSYSYLGANAGRKEMEGK